jgi:hypothetical protein
MSRKKPNLILKLNLKLNDDDIHPKPINCFGDYEYMFFHEVVRVLEKKGLTTDDIIGKKIGISFKVGCKRKLKSYRFERFEYVTRCECCGPVTQIW